VPASRIEAQARTISRPILATLDGRRVSATGPLANNLLGEPAVIVAGTLDTKGDELRFIRDIIREEGLRTRLVDLSTSGRSAGADVSPQEVALAHPRGSAGLASGRPRHGGRGHDGGVQGLAGAPAGGARRHLGGRFGEHRHGDRRHAGAAGRRPEGDDLDRRVRRRAGLCRRVRHHDDAFRDGCAGPEPISRAVLGNGARAIAGMARARLAELRREPAGRRADATEKPLVGLTMFGVTTPCVQQVTKLLAADWETLVFHATGTGGRAMEKLVDSGMLTGVIDVSTTEICDLMMGGILPATDDRLGAIIRTRVPLCRDRSARSTWSTSRLPRRCRRITAAATLYPHNPQITLMRTTADENARMGAWIGERLNAMEGPGPLSSPGTRRVGPRRARAAVPRSRRGCRAVRGAGAHRAADRQPADPAAAVPHQRPRLRGGAGGAVHDVARRPAPRAGGRR
jgi:hypothetical protein